MSGGTLDHVIVDVVFEFGGGGTQQLFVDVETPARGADMESEDAGGDEAVGVSKPRGCEEGELTPHSAVTALLESSLALRGAVLLLT